MPRRLREEQRKLRAAGLVGRLRDVLELNGVTWRSQAALRDRVAVLERAADDTTARDVLAMQAWLTAAPRSDLVVSVVLPTRDRAALLPRAIGSVRAQTHVAWELLVVDDASTDGTAALLDALDDDRIRVLRGPGRGAAAARNVALAAATGAVVTYLDDDNTLLPQWLAGVAWAFDARPETDVLYGACVRELERGRPELQLLPWDRAALRAGNLADVGVIAHRRAHPEARFDEALSPCADWELLARLTRRRDPLRLPVIAMRYSRDAPDRLSDGPGFEAERGLVAARVRAWQDGG